MPTLGSRESIARVIASEEIKKLLFAWYLGNITDKHFLIALKSLSLPVGKSLEEGN